MELIKLNKVVTIRKQVRLEEWAEMVRARRNSGLSVRRWCTENGVNQKTYYYRLQKVREFFCEEHHDIVPLAYDVPTPASSDIKIQSGNMNISMPCSISPEILSAAIEALKC